MFEHTQVTGTPDAWIALPDGYEPGSGGYERTAIGAGEALAMLREAGNIAEKLGREVARQHRDSDPARLIIGYSPVLRDDPKHGRDIKRAVEEIERYGRKVGVFCTETHDARKR